MRAGWMLFDWYVHVDGENELGAVSIHPAVMEEQLHRVCPKDVASLGTMASERTARSLVRMR